MFVRFSVLSLWYELLLFILCSCLSSLCFSSSLLCLIPSVQLSLCSGYLKTLINGISAIQQMNVKSNTKNFDNNFNVLREKLNLMMRTCENLKSRWIKTISFNLTIETFLKIIYLYKKITLYSASKTMRLYDKD